MLVSVTPKHAGLKIIFSHNGFIKHLMTDPKKNNEFCFPETLNVPRGEAKRNIEVEGKQNSPFPMGPVIECSVIPSNPKIERKTAKKIACLMLAGT